MTDSRKNLYRLLMVADNADAEVITAAYRVLARRHHPDVDASPDSVRLMAEINEAYATLRDPERRARYDETYAQRRDRRAMDRIVLKPGDVPFGEAGYPVGPPRGSVIDFGQYRGWTLGQISRSDPDFLEWLHRVPAGRQYRHEIEALLSQRRSHSMPADSGLSRGRKRTWKTPFSGFATRR